MIEREKIAARIRALLAKTVENGCTEAEALAAAQLAAKLLQQYELTLDEVQLRATPFGRHQAQHVDLIGERLARVGAAIAYLVGSTCWRSRRRGKRSPAKSLPRWAASGRSRSQSRSGCCLGSHWAARRCRTRQRRDHQGRCQRQAEGIGDRWS